jgi:hypothetical protein
MRSDVRLLRCPSPALDGTSSWKRPVVLKSLWEGAKRFGNLLTNESMADENRLCSRLDQWVVIGLEMAHVVRSRLTYISAVAIRDFEVIPAADSQPNEAVVSLIGRSARRRNALSANWPL